jgi:hypothetical protein
LHNRFSYFNFWYLPFDVTAIRGIYDPSSKTLALFNTGLPDFPQTTITLAIGSDFTGRTGTFKSDVNDKGFVFGDMYVVI